MTLPRRNRYRMNTSERSKFAYSEIVQDQPVLMKDYEKSDLAEGILSKHDRAELFDANRYRRKRPITKIFRDSKYVPALDDIEELDESTAENEIFVVLVNNPSLSLNSLHKERMRNHKGKVKRTRSKRLQNVNSTLSTLSEVGN